MWFSEKYSVNIDCKGKQAWSPGPPSNSFDHEASAADKGACAVLARRETTRPFQHSTSK